MRKVFSTLLFAALLASCSQDDALQSDQANGSGLVPLTITASLPDGGMATRTVNAKEDDQPARCLLQVCDGQGNPIEGDLAGVKPMNRNADNTFSLSGIYLDPEQNYTFLFWADGQTEDDPTGGYTATDLTNVKLAEGATPGIAWYHYMQNQKASSTIEAKLEHAVAKVTVKTTTDLDAGSIVSVTVPSTNGNIGMRDDVWTEDRDNTCYPFTVPEGGIKGTPGGTDVFSFYALVDDKTQNLTLTHKAPGTGSTEYTQQIPNVPLGPNLHTTLLGDVRNIGLEEVTFTANINENWGSTETKVIGLEIEEDGTYVVSTPEALLAWADAARTDLSLDCRLAADITLNGEWEPVGPRDPYSSANHPYTGTFDGNGHRISGLKITKGQSYMGFFEYVQGATIKNVIFDNPDVNISEGSALCGILVGNASNTTIENCHINGGTLNANCDVVGALVGNTAPNTTVKDCSSSAKVNNPYTGNANNVYTGGLIGYSTDCTIIGCHATGDVSQTYKGDRYTAYAAGGLVGNNVNTTIICSYATGTVTAEGSHAGGLVGFLQGGLPEIIACYATGTATAVTDNYGAGGILGFFSDGTITDCYYSGDNQYVYCIASNTSPNLDAEGVVGNNKINTNGLTWETAMAAMNTALAGSDYSEYSWELNTDEATKDKAPLVIKKQAQ